MIFHFRIVMRWLCFIAFFLFFAARPLYSAQEGFVNLDSARQSTIEACGPNDEAIVKLWLRLRRHEKVQWTFAVQSR